MEYVPHAPAAAGDEPIVYSPLAPRRAEVVAAAAPATVAVTPALPPTPPLQRQGTNLGLMLRATETESHPCIPMFYFTLDGAIELAEFRRRVDTSLGQYERFRFVLEGDVFVDRGFRIEDHVNEVSVAEFGGDGGGGVNRHSLRRFLERRFHTSMAEDRPMWELLMVRGYSDDEENKDVGTQTVVIARVHHAIVDGTAAMLMLSAMSDEGASGTLVTAEEQAQIRSTIAAKRQQVTGGCGPLGLGLGVASVLCKYASDLCKREPPSPFRGPTSGERSFSWASADAARSLEAARARGCTFNDLWMSSLAFAMGEFMRRRSRAAIDRSDARALAGAPGTTDHSGSGGGDVGGDNTDDPWSDEMQLSGGMPVSLHPPILPAEVGNTVGNRFGFLTVQLPVGPMASSSSPPSPERPASPSSPGLQSPGRDLGREARLSEVHERLDRAKRTPEALVSFQLAKLVGCVPTAAVQSVLAASGNTSCSVIMSNVRGPPRALHINGLNLSRLYGFLPAPAGVALGVGIGTYAGTVALSVACDKARLGEGAADEILRLMMEAHQGYLDTTLAA